MKKIALITGASRGIGAEIAKGLACRGYFVYINYFKSEDAAKTVLADIKATGGEADIIKADVSNLGEVEKMIDIIVKTYGQIDVLVNNAGVTKQNILCDASEEEYDLIMNTNMRGVFNLCKATYDNFVTNKKGTIINIASVDGVKGNSCESIYSASKGAVIAFSKALKKELKPSNVKVFYMAFGATDTDMLRQYGEEIYNYIKENCKIASPERIAKKVVKLIK